MREIREGLARCLADDRRAVLATIVQVVGSAYRREGARCLIYENGEVTGIVSGGCVEADLVEHARDVLATNTAKKLEYDFRRLNDEIWGLGLGCNGAITVWLQPFDPVNDRGAAEALLHEFRHRSVCGQPYPFMAVVDSAAPGIVRPGMHWRGNESGPRVEGVDTAEARTGLQECRVDGIPVTLFIERITVPPSLAVIGSGPDAALLARRAAELDWRVRVIDHREAYLHTYFSGIEQVLIARGDYGSVPFHPDSHVVIMTHNLDLDRLALAAVLPHEVAYIGVLGSRQRIGNLLRGITESGVELDERLLDKLYSPVGLDIGAETPEEITLSIVAEIIAVKNGRAGSPLRQMKEYDVRHANVQPE